MHFDTTLNNENESKIFFIILYQIVTNIHNLLTHLILNTQSMHFLNIFCLMPHLMLNEHQ